MHILLAPNAFKNSLDAKAVAEAIAEGLKQSSLDCTIGLFPIGDGGNGTAGLIIQKYKGLLVSAAVHDALGRELYASFGLINNGTTAVIELADASGIHLLQPHELDPLHTTTFGTGELIAHALDKGVSTIIMCIGGSATVDGGTGILRALGARFIDKNNQVLENLPEDLIRLEKIDLSGFDKRIFACNLTILCDVDNNLLGQAGAAVTFGPQKGASAAVVQKLEEALTRLCSITIAQTGTDMGAIKHGGAAGGVAASLAAFCNATLVNGIDYFLTTLGFEQALEEADLVITGEGSIDSQTLQGKGPYGVAIRAKAKNIKVIGIAGKIPVNTDLKLLNYFHKLVCINDGVFDLAVALENTKYNLQRTAKIIGNQLAAEGL